MQKTKRFFLIILFFIFYGSKIVCEYGSKIYQDDTFNFLLQEIETLTDQDLVVFDVDGVLLIEQDAIFGVKAENKALWNKYFGKGTYFRTLSYEQQRYLYSIIRQQSICVPIENVAESLIARLKKNGVRSIALTSIKTGRNGIIEKTEDWRFEQLKKIGVDFSYSFSLEEPFVLKNFICDRIFAQRGIVFAGEYGKGDVLKSFLHEMAWKPDRIFFIDDHRVWIDSVDRMCQELDVHFFGLHYIGAEKMSACIDLEVVNFQIDYFFKYQIWLSDEQARSGILK